MKYHVCLLALLVVLSPSHAWWDTQIQVVRHPPTVLEVQGEDCPDLPPELIVADTLAWGGKAALLQPGGPALSFSYKAAPSHYVLHLICRSGAGELPETHPVTLAVKATNRTTGEAREWAYEVNYTTKTYEHGPHVYIPVYVGGDIDVEVRSDAKSKAALQVDFLVLKDVFGELPRRGEKRATYLTSKNEIKALRATESSLKVANATYEELIQAGAYGDTAAWRQSVFDHLWAQRPARNTIIDNTLTGQYAALRKQLNRDADAYLRTGNTLIGYRAAVTLISLADLYPDIDYQAHSAKRNTAAFGMNPLGKLVYSGWAINFSDELIEAYDKVFPIIQSDAELASLIGAKLPGVDTNEKLIQMLDTNILQHIRDCVDRQVIRAGEGDSELVCVKAGVVQGPGPAGQWILLLPFTRCHMRMMNRGGLQDHLFSTTASDGLDFIGSMEYAKARPNVAATAALLIGRYKEIGGKPLFDISATERYPGLLSGTLSVVDRVVAGQYTPRIGDWGTIGDPGNHPTKEDRDFRPMYTFGFEKTGDPRFAWFLHFWGRASETDAQWDAIVKAAASVPADNPFLLNRTRTMPGIGLAILEAGTSQELPWKRSAAILRAGIGQGHGHNDQLALFIYGKGIRAVVGNGRRGGPNNSRKTKWHPTMEIDDTDFMPRKFGSSGTGWFEAVADLGGDLGYASGVAVSPSHPQVKLFRRDVAMVPLAADESFVFDVLRVDGGTIHTWSNPGPAGAEGGLSLNATLAPGELSATYLKGMASPAEGLCGDTLQATWQVDPDLTKRAYDRQAPNGNAETPTSVRAWHLDTQGQKVITGFGGFSDYAIKNPMMRNFVFVRAESDQPISAAYPTVTEVYIDGKPTLTNVESLPVTGGSTGALAAKGVRVTAASGVESIVISTGDGAACEAGGVQLAGDFGIISTQGTTLQRLALVGGTRLSGAGFTIQTPAAHYSGTVTGLDLDHNTVDIDTPWPALLGGETIAMRRPHVAHNQASVATSIAPIDGGSRITMYNTLKVYQTAITHFHDTGMVTVEMPFVLRETDTTYYDGLLVLNEANTQLGIAKIVDGDRWMFLDFPEHQHWNQRIHSLDELADADGDGRRMMSMYATNDKQRRLSPEPASLANGDLMGQIEVLRISPDGRMMWFKDMPEVYSDSAGIPHRNWPYVDQSLVSEDGKRRIIATYPGDDELLSIPGRPLTATDFPDVDGDGRQLVMLSHVAPGDTLSLPTRVSLTAIADGLYELHANVGLELTLPVDTAHLVTREGELWHSTPIGSRTLKLSTDQLTSRILIAIPDAQGTIRTP